MIAEARGATYLRIDTIEQALRDSGVVAGDMGPAGYVVAYALAEDNLRMGREVVADSVNPLAVTRAAWRAIAARTASPLAEVEVICSDAAEHRRRVELRAAPPTWDEVVRRTYEPWDGPRIVLDTAHRSIPDAVAALHQSLP
jgi:predicted kinase